MRTQTKNNMQSKSMIGGYKDGNLSFTNLLVTSTICSFVTLKSLSLASCLMTSVIPDKNNLAPMDPGGTGLSVWNDKIISFVA